MIDALCETRVVLRPLGRWILIEKNDVKIGRVAKLLTAELAISNDCEARYIPMAGSQPLPRNPQHLGEDEIGKRAQLIRQLLEG